MFRIGTAMTAATSWGIVALFCLLMLALAWVITIALDYLELRRRARYRAEDPVAQVFRLDEAREALRRIYEQDHEKGQGA